MICAHNDQQLECKSHIKYPPVSSRRNLIRVHESGGGVGKRQAFQYHAYGGTGDGGASSSGSRSSGGLSRSDLSTDGNKSLHLRHHHLEQRSASVLCHVRCTRLSNVSPLVPASQKKTVEVHQHHLLIPTYLLTSLPHQTNLPTCFGGAVPLATKYSIEAASSKYH